MKIEQHNARTDRFDAAIAKRLGLDPSQVVAGSMHGDYGSETVTVRWEGYAVLSRGEFDAVRCEAEA
ncbi:hypothetical protein ACPPVT_07385 [Angustibacter sp. McL0619]|uniref:hypothetical protein n=1 Tax=Angustibacter sp. McL0619 TaxID=3415676 RepID=UPI003CEA6C4F